MLKIQIVLILVISVLVAPISGYALNDIPLVNGNVAPVKIEKEKVTKPVDTAPQADSKKIEESKKEEEDKKKALFWYSLGTSVSSKVADASLISFPITVASVFYTARKERKSRLGIVQELEETIYGLQELDKKNAIERLKEIDRQITLLEKEPFKPENKKKLEAYDKEFKNLTTKYRKAYKTANKYNEAGNYPTYKYDPERNNGERSRWPVTVEPLKGSLESPKRVTRTEAINQIEFSCPMLMHSLVSAKKPSHSGKEILLTHAVVGVVSLGAHAGLTYAAGTGRHKIDIDSGKLIESKEKEEKTSLYSVVFDDVNKVEKGELKEHTLEPFVRYVYESLLAHRAEIHEYHVNKFATNEDKALANKAYKKYFMDDLEIRSAVLNAAIHYGNERKILTMSKLKNKLLHLDTENDFAVYERDMREFFEDALHKLYPKSPEKLEIASNSIITAMVEELLSKVKKLKNGLKEKMPEKPISSIAPAFQKTSPDTFNEAVTRSNGATASNKP